MSFNKGLIVVLMIFGLVGYEPAVASGSANQESVSRDGERYLPGDALSAIETARIKAIEADKLVLVIMGANWCHDSRALASRISEQPLKELIDRYYELVFVDVGYLNKGRDVIKSLGEPVWYATPTVLIIDPVSHTLVNTDNRHQWGNAANISLESSLSYFQLIAGTDLQAIRRMKMPEGQLKSLLEEIREFEQQQADRIYQAYAILTPMLEAWDNGEKDKFSEKVWAEIREFRTRVPLDMEVLRHEARKRVAAGESSIRLKYPDYPSFSWELRTSKNQ